MGALIEQPISCPYCGENIVVLIEPQDFTQQYIEDCQVCCRPIHFTVSQSRDQLLRDQLLYVEVHSEDDVY